MGGVSGGAFVPREGAAHESDSRTRDTDRATSAYGETARHHHTIYMYMYTKDAAKSCRSQKSSWAAVMTHVGQQDQERRSEPQCWTQHYKHSSPKDKLPTCTFET